MLAVPRVVVAGQPVAAAVFVLDEMLIGAGDQNYLASAELLSTAVVGAAAAVDVAPEPGCSGCGSRCAPGSPRGSSR